MTTESERIVPQASSLKPQARQLPLVEDEAKAAMMIYSTWLALAAGGLIVAIKLGSVVGEAITSWLR